MSWKDKWRANLDKYDISVGDIVQETGLSYQYVWDIKTNRKVGYRVRDTIESATRKIIRRRQKSDKIGVDIDGGGADNGSGTLS